MRKVAALFFLAGYIHAGDILPLPNPVAADTNVYLTVCWRYDDPSGAGGTLLAFTNTLSGEVKLTLVTSPAATNSYTFTNLFNGAQMSVVAFSVSAVSLPSNVVWFPPVMIHNWVVVSSPVLSVTNDALAAPMKFYHSANFGLGEVIDTKPTVTELVNNSIFWTTNRLTITNWPEWK